MLWPTSASRWPADEPVIAPGACHALSFGEIVAIADAFPDAPLLFNAIDGGRTPLPAPDRLRELGVRLILELVRSGL